MYIKLKEILVNTIIGYKWMRTLLITYNIRLVIRSV